MTRVAFIALCLGACTVSSLDYSGFDCPCPESYECVCVGSADERCMPTGEARVCVQPMRDAGAADSRVGTDVGPDGGSDVGDANIPPCEGGGQFQIANLRRDWATQNVIAITWDVITRDPDLFGRYEVELRGGAELLTFSLSTNPELGEYDLDLNGTVVEQTWLRNLEPGTVYDIRLSAYDSTADGVCRLDGSFSTPARDRFGSMVIYEDTGGSTSPCASSSSASPFEGERHLRGEIACDTAGMRHCGPELPEYGDSCFYNLVFRPGEPAIPEQLVARFDEAYLEFSIRGTGEGLASSDWSLTGLRTRQQEDVLGACGGCIEDDLHWGINGFTVPISAEPDYHTFQIPLSELRLTTRQPVTRSRHMEASDLGPFFWFIVGGTWPNGMTFDVDSIRIHW